MKKILLDNRKKLIMKYCKQKSVLDIGCVCGIGGDTNKFTHQLICENSSDVIGIDNDETSIKEYKKRGYNVIFGDAQHFNLERRFDVVFAGEIIEHLEDQSIFLDNVKKHLKKGGILILTTPNAHDIAYHLNRIFGRYNDDYEQCKNIGHVIVHSYGTLRNLIEKKGFEIIEAGYVNDICITWRRKLLKLITKIYPDFGMGLFFVVKVK